MWSLIDINMFIDKMYFNKLVVIVNNFDSEIIRILGNTLQ